MNPEQVEMLAQIQCSAKEIAAVLGISFREFERRRAGHHKDDKAFVEALESGRHKGCASMRRIQFEQAKTSPHMAIWWGKMYMGQREPEPPANEAVQNFLWQLAEQQKNGPAKKPVVQNCETCGKPMGECECEPMAAAEDEPLKEGESAGPGAEAKAEDK